MPEVNPLNLRWARETAALTIEQAAKRIGLGGKAAVAQLQKIEAGQLVPSQQYLIGMSRAYNRPLLALYVREPPERGERAHDRRTMRGDSAKNEAQLDAILRNAHVRQSILRDALESADEDEAIPQIASVSRSAGADTIATAIIKATKFDLRAFRAKKSIEEAFAFARDSVESLGVFVLLIGDLGHYTSKVSQKVFRGISLPDNVVPIIVINDNDAKSAWTFTLFHELAHLFMGESAISGYGSDSEVERLCDDVATRILLPRLDLESIEMHAASFEQQLHEIDKARRRWNISRLMVAYNLMRAEKISKEHYQRLAAQFDSDRLEYPQGGGDGGNFYTTRSHRLGGSFIRTVGRLVASRALTASKGAIILGLKSTQVGRLVDVSRQ